MNRQIALAVVAVAGTAVLTGCSAKDRFVGTWQSEREVKPEREFDFGAVTFAPDNTYTARMLYGGETVAETGHWSVSFGGLNIDDNRRYTYEFDGDGRVILTDRETGIELELQRFE
jgi:hypothetical protein